MSHHGIGRPVKPVVLNDSERSFLQGVVDAGHVGKQAQMRCRAILLCAEGLSNGEVGEKLGISNNRVSILRSRFLKSCAQEQSDTVVERSRDARNGEISAATRRWAYGSRGKSANPVQLTREERFALVNCLRDLDTPSAIATRCRIILLCTDGLSDRAIAKELSLSSNTVRDWRARFLKDRINGLLDKRKANRGYRLVRGLGGPAIDLVRDGRVSTPPAVVLDEDERLSLKSLALGLRGTGARSDRCRMILRCADGLTNEEVAADLGVGRQTVDRWQRCFLEDGIWGLLSRPWLGLGPPLTSEQAAEVINRSLNTTPVDAPRWTAQGMAEAMARQQGERYMNDSSNEPAADDSDDGLIIDLATGLMIAVTATGVLKGANDETKRYAGEVLERELEKFCKGEGEYGINRERVAAGDMREAESVATLVASCTEKIAVFKLLA